DGAVASGLGAGDAENSGKRPQRNENTGQKLGHLVVPVEIDVADSPFRKLLGELPGDSGIIHVHPIGARHDFVDLHLEHVARLGAFDIDRPGEGMRAAALQLLANLEQHVQARARHEAIVEMHHCFHDDAVAWLDDEHRLLRIARTSPTGWSPWSPEADGLLPELRSRPRPSAPLLPRARPQATFPRRSLAPAWTASSFEPPLFAKRASSIDRIRCRSGDHRLAHVTS